MPASDEKNQIFDVSKPGKVSAGASSRPIIVTHKMVQDPMMNKAELLQEPKVETVSDVSVTAASTASMPSRNKVITPLSQQAKEPVTEKQSESPESTSENKQGNLTSTESAVVDAVAEQATSRKHNINLSDADVEKQIVVNRLVDEKKYFVKIKAARHKRDARLVSVLLLTFFIGLLGFVTAVDAEMLDLGVKLPFDFIKKKSPAIALVVPDAQKKINTVTPTVSDPVPIDTEAATWKLVKSGKSGFSVRMPDGWKYINFTDLNKVVGERVIYSKGSLAEGIEVNNSSVAETRVDRFEVVQFKSTDTFKILDGDEQKSDFSIGTLKGTKYVKKYPATISRDVGPYPGTERYVYEFKSSDKVTFVVYNIFNYNQYTKNLAEFTKNDTNQLVLVEKSVRSLVIN